MLVLSRRAGEDIVIAGKIRLRILSITGRQIRLGIEAPRSMPVDRAEVNVRRNKKERMQRPNSGERAS